MSERPLSQLQELANQVTTAEKQSDKVIVLSQAIALFSEEATRLEGAYTSLKSHLDTLQNQLSTTRSHLDQKAEELDITAHYLTTILDSVQQGILFISREGKVTTFNRSASEILAIAQIEALLCPYSEVFTDNFFGFSMKQALTTRTLPASLRITLPSSPERPQEKELDIEASYIDHPSPVPDQSTPSAVWDFTQGLLLTIRDVTEIQALEMQVRQLERMKELGEMVSLISHEIRNPLGGIRGFAHLLRDEVSDNKELSELTNHMISGVDDLNNIVNDIVNYSRPFEAKRELTDIHAIATEVAENMRANSDFQKDITFVTEFPKTPLIIPIEATLIKMCLFNLLKNSVDAIPKKGTVTLSTKEDSARVTLFVTDTGEGIPEEMQTKIFRPFFTTKKKGKGTGFGLAEVARAMRAHHGSIDVESNEGKGSTFRLVFPKNICTKV